MATNGRQPQELTQRPDQANEGALTPTGDATEGKSETEPEQTGKQWPTDHAADPVIAERWGSDASVWPY